MSPGCKSARLSGPTTAHPPPKQHKHRGFLDTHVNNHCKLSVPPVLLRTRRRHPVAVFPSSLAGRWTVCTLSAAEVVEIVGSFRWEGLSGCLLGCLLGCRLWQVRTVPLHIWPCTKGDHRMGWVVTAWCSFITQRTAWRATACGITTTVHRRIPVASRSRQHRRPPGVTSARPAAQRDPRPAARRRVRPAARRQAGPAASRRAWPSKRIHRAGAPFARVG